jgi:hypothetical protein
VVAEVVLGASVLEGISEVEVVISEEEVVVPISIEEENSVKVVDSIEDVVEGSGISELLLVSALDVSSSDEVAETVEEELDPGAADEVLVSMLDEVEG